MKSGRKDLLSTLHNPQAHSRYFTNVRIPSTPHCVLSKEENFLLLLFFRIPSSMCGGDKPIELPVLFSSFPPLQNEVIIIHPTPRSDVRIIGVETCKAVSVSDTC